MPKSSPPSRDAGDVETPTQQSPDAAETLTSARHVDANAALAATDSANLLNLCLELESEAQAKVQYLGREHLLVIHRSVASLKEMIEDALISEPIEGVH